MNPKGVKILLTTVSGSEKAAVCSKLKNILGERGAHDVEVLEGPEIVADSQETAEQSAAKVAAWLDGQGLLPKTEEDKPYSDEEEEKIKKRLSDLGYI